jgi:predicted transcriptional regulator
MRKTPTRRAATTGASAKEKAVAAVMKLPADATLEDAIERLVLLAKIEHGLAEVDSGKGVRHSEATRRLLR